MATFGWTLLILSSVVMTAIATTTLSWMLHAWRTPATLEATGFTARASHASRTFSLLVPARHEVDVLGQTLDRLAQLEHPAYEVIAIVGDDDPETTSVALQAAVRHRGRIRVVVDSTVPKSKPAAMNTALPLCRGNVVGVFDAEDDVHPAVLRHVDATFAQERADIVQGGVQLMNFRRPWWAVRNCLEYWFWFRSRMHFHADARFIPLGGNTVFVDTQMLRDAGGWAADCLAEDCELGVRLSSRGARVAVCYEPEIVTREETPESVGAWLKQRCRWDQGFLQVYRKKEWRNLPTWRQRNLARYTLAMPFLQAFTGVMAPISVGLMLWASVPVSVALIALLPLVPTLLMLVAETAALGDFTRTYGQRARVSDYARLILGAVPYQVLLAIAALRAVVRESRGDGSWEKTAHANLHRVVSAPATSEVAA